MQLGRHSADKLGRQGGKVSVRQVIGMETMRKTSLDLVRPAAHTEANKGGSEFLDDLYRRHAVGVKRWACRLESSRRRQQPHLRPSPRLRSLGFGVRRLARPMCMQRSPESRR